MSSPRFAIAALAVAAISWGAIPLIVREDIPVSHLVAARATFGAIALVAVLPFVAERQFPRSHRGRIIAAGVLIAVHWAMFFASLKATEVAVALAVSFLGPIAASALAPLVLGERAPLRAYAGLGICFAGVLLVIRPGGGATLAGVGWAAGAAATFALVFLVAKPAAEANGGLVVATGELVVASLVLSPWTVRAAVESWRHLPLFVVLGVLITGAGFVALWNALSRLPITVVSVFMYFEPAFAVVWAALFLSETPDLLAWLGVSLVIAGGVLAALAALAARLTPSSFAERSTGEPTYSGSA